MAQVAEGRALYWRRSVCPLRISFAGGDPMTQAAAPTKAPRRSVPLEVTPEARPLLTPFRERTFRAMHEAALEDGGAEIIVSAAIVRLDPISPDLETELSLFCEVDASWEEARKAQRRITLRVANDLFPTWSDAERGDYSRWIGWSVIPTQERLIASA